MSNKEIIDKLSEHVSEARWEKMQGVVSRRTRYLTMVMEDIYQGHNAAAVVRSAEAYGVQDVHVIEVEHELKLSKSTVSRGAYKWLDIKYHKETQGCLKGLKDQGYGVVVTALGKDAVGLDDLPMDRPLAVVLGTEMKGVSDVALEEADYLLEVPMYGFTQSYNLSVCGAIIMHHLMGRIRKEGRGWELSEDEQEALLVQWLKKCIPHWEGLLV